MTEYHVRRYRPDDVDDVWRVHPDHQRRGFAAELLSLLEGSARKRGYERACLETNAELRAARAFYESYGYRETGESERHGGDLRMVHYEKQL